MNVYDNHKKITYKGKILEIMGRNDFLVETENGNKHVSGDVLSHIPEIVNRPVGGSIDNEDGEDLESITSAGSDMSEDLEDIITPLNNADPYGNNLRFRRSRRREIDQLDRSGVSLPRLRSGR